MPRLLPLLLLTCLLQPLGARDGRGAVAPEPQQLTVSRVDSLPGSPTRPWRHQLRAAVGWARGMEPSFGPMVIYGIGVDYHHLRQWGSLAGGPGIGIEVVQVSRQERLASLTAQAEYQVGKGKLRPLLRLTGGVALPVGSPDMPIHSRSGGPLLHPALGVLLLPPGGQWGAIVLDLGYRFSRVAFGGTDHRGDAFHRTATYRRLTLGISSRF